MAQTQTQTQIATEEIHKNGGWTGFRTTLRKWRDGLKKDKSLSGIPTPTPTPPPTSSSSSHSLATAPSPTSQIPPSSSPPSDALALFKPTTQTYIHSPLDKRNKTSSSSSSASTFRRSYLGSIRYTAPADYFSFATNTVAANGAANATRSLRPTFSISKRRSSAVQPLASPAPSAPSPVGHQNQRHTFQYTTAAELSALMGAHERGGLMDVVEVVEVKEWDKPTGEAEACVEGGGEISSQKAADEGVGKESSRREESSDGVNKQAGKCESEKQGTA
ncbi:uncharacterized protein K460DRAFT_357458 [Cucurbitaria berberidis CBS 394.84]|uniref:Uncharacterized protein n=1 Tax=Cucurbitaria berberidis CBS 394.84 TaxID=1168544 RepID=A0A9P4L6B2_9PLEO|nr:uncharacterized protein K460DRAFT_357458 [Cucurbitaria berberidis CBS 394.84]KAF1843771.1 hypothetical protein K460DRAFT_357458 [Cucurbitaria berberidis CBS 394.84]